MSEIRLKASAIPNAANCERRAVASSLPNLVEGKGYALRKLPWGISPAIGVAWHRAVSLTLQGDTKVEALNRAAEELKKDVAKGTMTFDKTTKDVTVALQQIGRMYAATEQFLSEVKPKHIEERFEAEIGGIKVVGILDLCTEEGIIYDYKTGATKPSSAQLQAGLYALLVKSNGGTVTGLKQLFIKRSVLKSEQPSPVIEEYDLKDSEIESYHAAARFAASLKRFDDTGKPQEFTANPSSYLCSAKFCPAHGTTFCGLGRKATTGDTEDD